MKFYIFFTRDANVACVEFVFGPQHETSWPWNNNDRRLRLSNIAKEIKWEVLTSSRRTERSWTF